MKGQTLLQGDIAQILHEHGPLLVGALDDGGHPHHGIEEGLEGAIVEIGIIGIPRYLGRIQHDQSRAQLGMFHAEVLPGARIAA